MQVGNDIDKLNMYYRKVDYPKYDILDGLPAPMAAEWQPPLKIEFLKISFVHVTRGPKTDIEPNFHDHTTSNVKDYPGKPKLVHFVIKGPYGSPS